MGRGRRKGLIITLTDSVYVSKGAVGADRLDKVSDWPGGDLWPKSDG